MTLEGKLLESKLKFCRSDRNGELIGFVKLYKDRLLGVREDKVGKKMICLLSQDLKKQNLKENVLYSVKMAKMNSKNGYVVKEAIPVKFKATVKAQIIPKITYQVIIKFGNKTVYYNPFDAKSESFNRLESVIDLINSREDIKDPEKVIEELKEAATLVVRKMADDGYVCHDTKSNK